MKIAVPTKDKHVDSHFGHCQAYTVFTIDENKKVISTQTIPSPQGCGCKSNIASVLKEMGVNLMLAGNMGDGALNVLYNHGIKVIRGCSGPIDPLVEGFLRGDVVDSGKGCDHPHHDEAHQCQH